MRSSIVYRVLMKYLSYWRYWLYVGCSLPYIAL